MDYGLKFAVPIEWNKTSTYKKKAIVFIENKSYTALRDVPAKTEITNTYYWQETGLVAVETDIPVGTSVKLEDGKLEISLTENYSGETVTMGDTCGLQSLSLNGKSEQDGTPSPTNIISIVSLETLAISVNGAETQIPLNNLVLCSLPDGTHDELHIDSSGSVNVVKRVGIAEYDGDETWTAYSRWNGNDQYCYYSFLPLAKPSTVPLCTCCEGIDRNVFGGSDKPINTCTIDSSKNICVRVPNSTVSTWKSWLASNNTVVLYELNEAVTSKTGEITVPELPNESVVEIESELDVAFTLSAWVNQAEPFFEIIKNILERLAILEA